MSARGILILNIAEIIFSILCYSMAQLEEWKIPCDAVYKPKGCENASIETLNDIEGYERCAPARLKIVDRNFVWSASGEQETAFWGNKEAYKRIWIKTKVLRGPSSYGLETSVFGRKIRVPLGISPSAGHSYFHPDGERGMARGAADVGAIMILDVYSSTSLEDVAAAVPKDAELWMHTYIFHNRQLTVDVVRRAEAAGYKAIVLTVDALIFHDLRCNARNVHINYYKGNLQPNILGYNATDVTYDVDAGFQDITWLAGITKLPIVVKGILTAEDALQAIAAGASAIFVSNHGGRELEAALPTIDALPAIARAVKFQYPWVPVFVDGGIRSGDDVFKALARGATVAFVGRPAIWGLTMGGEKGVEKILTILREELKETLYRTGNPDPSKVAPSNIVSQWIYSYFN